MQVATELHRLAWLNAAYHGLALSSPSGADRCSLSWWGWAPAAAHLPLHVAAAERLQALAVLAKAAKWTHSSSPTADVLQISSSMFSDRISKVVTMSR